MEYILLTLLSEDFKSIDKFLAFVLSISIREEEQTKIVALEYLRFACYRFEKLPDASKWKIMNCLLVLMKDDIFEIREKAADCFRTHVELHRFYPKNTLERTQLRPLQFLSMIDREIIYKLTLSFVMFEGRKFKSGFGSSAEILYFIKLWTQNIHTFNTGTTIENPFRHDDVPAYREESKFLDSCFTYLVRNIDKSIDFKSRYLLEEQIDVYAYDDLGSFLNLNSIDYVQMKLRALCARLEEGLEENDE
ncbi:hypothetical protein KM043_018142 [Ampulex compressa]|nr:hypothetical protein KM043_018142 [Ampulex compressa]